MGGGREREREREGDTERGGVVRVVYLSCIRTPVLSNQGSILMTSLALVTSLKALFPVGQLGLQHVNLEGAHLVLV